MWLVVKWLQLLFLTIIGDKMVKKELTVPLNFEPSSHSLQEQLNEFVLLVLDNESMLTVLIVSGSGGWIFQWLATPSYYREEKCRSVCVRV